MNKNSSHKTWKDRLHEIIYEADTPAGKSFDLIILIMILASIILVMLESVSYINEKHASLFNILEWIITIVFTIEYFLRIIAINKPKNYIFSFFGIIDFLSTIPKYLSLLFIGTHALVALRALRLLRVFRILKLARFIGESNRLVRALKASRAKIAVFLFAVLIVSIILGTVMYLVEGSEHGFNSIPKSVYWCIVTLTTVGYGDISPETPLGQLIASVIMILGYGIIAVPTGIVSAEYTQQHKKINLNTQSCGNCHEGNHSDNAKFCHKCGENLHNG
ncbi:ion transporter [Aquimarina sp. 2201CG5-10]|uniref:ion transporter n=1 Tax=Aquimarina callyspongiae TaxID=3098150 RepID=UPI002AB54F1C|nr:ion transporter [Aquimarina sp. 2201CG5-10]MDY8138256.1 ion transporter [Aquimarina sp. 2201CG5-10]